MRINESKINLTNKICSILFFAFTIINFVLSILIIVNVNGKNDFYKTILNIPFAIFTSISIVLNIYLIIGLLLENKQNYKNPMLYLLIVTFLITLIIYIYCFVSLNNKAIDSENFTTEFWLLLVSSGISVLFSGWNCLVCWKLLKPLFSIKKDDEQEDIDLLLESTDFKEE